MKARRIIVLFIALALIVVLEVMLVARCSRQAATPEPPPTADTAETMAPQTMVPGPMPTTNGHTPRPQVTETPAPTEAPATPTPTTAPTPTPTIAPTPTPSPTPVDVVDTLSAMGSFSSDTGTSLNMGVSWSAVDHGDGTTTITVSGTVTSYSLNLGVTAISVSFEGYSASATGNSLNVDSGSLVTNGLFSTSMTVPTGTAGMMTVSWGYNGSYNDTSLGTITASDFVYT